MEVEEQMEAKPNYEWSPILDGQSAFFDAETWLASQLQLAEQLWRLHAIGQQSYTTHNGCPV